MNARLKLFFLANLSRQKIGSDRGFALPIALMVGMVILVVGATMIIRAQGDQSKIIAQATSNKAMAIAEAGATRYVDFLNNNRGLIPYDSCAVVNTETGACADDTASTTTTATWVTANSAVGKLTGIGTGTSPQPVGGTTSCSSSAGGGGTPPPSYQTVDSTTISNTWANAASSGNSSGWRNLPNEQNPEGQYRLVSYKVDRTGNWADPNNPPSNFSATLVVEGRVNVSGTGADAINTGKARVAFTIPVTASTVTGGGGGGSGSGFPGLWAKDFAGFGGAAAVYADVWDSSGCVSGASSAASVPFANVPSTPLTLWRETGTKNPKETVPGDKANNGNKDLYMQSSVLGKPIVVNRGFPALPNNTVPGSNINSCPLSSGQLPKDNNVDSAGNTYKENGTGTAPANATYLYNCNSSEVTTPGSDLILGRTGQETLKFYISGALKVNSDGNLVPYTSQAWTSGLLGPYQPFTRSIFYVGTYVQFNGKGNVGDMRDPTAMQFYVYGSDAGTINTGGYQHTLEMKGNSSFYGFLFAPNGNLSGVGTSDLGGALWIKSIEKSTGNTKIWQGIFNSTRLDVTIPSGGNVTTYNLDGQPSSWQRTSLDTVTVPSVPTGITGTSAVQPSISWPANSTGTTPNYYTLFRCQTTSANGTCTPGTPVKAYKQGSSNYSYAESFQPTASQRKFCYAATASNAGGDSARSSVVCGADKT